MPVFGSLLTCGVSFLIEIKESVLQLLFPHLCTGCGSDLLSKRSELCMRCIEALPETNFELYPANPVEKTFWGRIPLLAATAQFYFTKTSLIQHLMHQLKYRGDQELGIQLGKIMGVHLMKSTRFETEALVPLPLFPAKERKRGFNQATILCQGMAEMMQVPILQNVISRPQHTETQTRKGRVERWKNIEGKFILNNASAISNKRILLVDDVITTGATLESCGMELLKAHAVQLSVATLCYASR